MAILSFKVDSMGDSGQVPKFIYINTNNTVAEVTVAGYLNALVQQGNPLQETDMALVATRATPDSKEVAVNIYDVSHVNGKWSLVATGGSGSGFNPALSYNGIANPAISGSWVHEGPFSVSAGSGDVDLQSDQGDVNVLAPNAGQFVNLQASNVAIVGATATTISGSTFTGTFTGNASLSASGPLSLSGSSVLVPGLVQTSTANVVYYNQGTGALTYGAAAGSSFNPASPQTITGAWAMNGGFSVTSASGNIPIVASAGNISLVASSGNVSLNSPNLLAPALTNVVTANAIYYNTSSGLLSYGAVSSFDPAANYTVTGSWQHNGSFNVAAPSGDVSIGASVGSINLLAPTAGKTIAIQSPTVSVLATSAFNSTAGSSSLQTTGSGTFAISAGGVLSLQGAGGINMPTLASSAATPNAVFYNAGTGFLSYAPAPTGGFTWSTATAPTTLAANHGYIANSTSLVSFDLPTVAAVGAEFKIVGRGTGGWSISQNAGQSINLGSVSSSIGTGGAVASINPTDCISLVCTVANTSFAIYNSVGNISLT